MIEAFVGLGANLGPRRQNLRRGLWSIGLPILTVSSLYETSAVETEDAQPDYLNAVALLLAPEALPAEELLRRLLAVERRLGRERTRPKGPRTLDLDLLLFGERSCRATAAGALELPHPGILHRRFVLEPLLEIRPGATLPGGDELAARLAATRQQVLRRVYGRCWWWQSLS